MSTQLKYAEECHSEFVRYRDKCRSTVRGDGIHDLWVKLAWRNRQQARQWAHQAA